jgi:hypothetical protein
MTAGGLPLADDGMELCCKLCQGEDDLQEQDASRNLSATVSQVKGFANCNAIILFFCGTKKWWQPNVCHAIS